MGSRRRELLDALSIAGRESTTATVMFHTAVAEKAGLTASDVKTMDILARNGRLTAGELSVHTGLATASVTSLIDRLEAKGMVRRVRNTDDRRLVIVEPVAERIAGGASLFGPIQRAFAALAEDYSDDQLLTILDFMRRTTERARELTATLARTKQSSDSVPAPGRRKPGARSPEPSNVRSRPSA